MAVLEVDLQGDAEFRARLLALSRRIDDLSPALERVGEEFRAWMATVFDSEGGANVSVRWTALSTKGQPSYAQWKASHYPGKPILEREGDLRQSLTAAGGDNLSEVHAQEATFGTALQVARGGWNLGLLHQKGTRRGMPARPIIDPPPEVILRWTQIVLDHLNGVAP